MKTYTSHEIRKKFLDYFKKQGHAIIASASVVPENDPTAQYWTAQAELTSLLIALKQSRLKGWTISKHDVKGACCECENPC